MVLLALHSARWKASTIGVVRGHMEICVYMTCNSRSISPLTPPHTVAPVLRCTHMLAYYFTLDSIHPVSENMQADIDDNYKVVKLFVLCEAKNDPACQQR